MSGAVMGICRASTAPPSSCDGDAVRAARRHEAAEVTDIDVVIDAAYAPVGREQSPVSTRSGVVRAKTS